jgi:hypothetical protein
MLSEIEVMEDTIWALDQKINDKGIPVDTEALEATQIEIESMCEHLRIPRQSAQRDTRLGQIPRGAYTRPNETDSQRNIGRRVAHGC